MTSTGALERLQDQEAVRDVITRFSDAATLREPGRGPGPAVRALWSADARWTIGGSEDQPFERRAEGIDDVAALFATLRAERDYFLQLVVPGAVEVDGDEARVRSLCQEAARGPGESCYRTSGIWSDRLRRSERGWLFTQRSYRYLWLDTSAFAGDVFPATSHQGPGER